jgi:hypothetical protein
MDMCLRLYFVLLATYWILFAWQGILYSKRKDSYRDIRLLSWMVLVLMIDCMAFIVIQYGNLF